MPRARNSGWTFTTTSVSYNCTFDGKPCLVDHLITTATSPEFTLDIVDGSPLGPPYGLNPGVVSTGFSVYLPPLSDGVHTLSTGANMQHSTSILSPFELYIEWTITVGGSCAGGCTRDSDCPSSSYCKNYALHQAPFVCHGCPASNPCCA